MSYTEFFSVSVSPDLSLSTQLTRVHSYLLLFTRDKVLIAAPGL